MDVVICEVECDGEVYGVVVDDCDVMLVCVDVIVMFW